MRSCAGFWWKARIKQAGFHLGNVHDTTDTALKKRAAQLKVCGAVQLLREELPWQCAIIEHIDELLVCLSGST